MKTLVALCCLVAVVSAVSFIDLVREEWTTYKLQHKKKYDSDLEERFRMKIFADNKHRIELHNQRYEQGLVSFKLGQNKYGDMLHHEFINTMNGFNKTVKPKRLLYSSIRGATYIPPAHTAAPHTVDWRRNGAVTPVKDQGMCGSCWSFSTTGSLEGQNFRKAGVLVSLSEQNLIDCSTSYGNNGCHGGYVDNAFKYVIDNRGIDTEKTYPYEGKDGKCKYNAKNSGADEVSFVDIPERDEEKLKLAIATVGPVSVAIDASQENFQFYSKGVYYDENCSQTELDHAVLAVGYGTDQKDGDYWLIKNSWGLSWGDEGYIKMARNRNNHCGVATSASYPIV